MEAEELESQVAYAAHAMTGSVSQHPHGLPADVVGSAIAHELSTPLPEGRRAVLLIFDAVERLGEGSQGWLHALLNDLHRRTHLGTQEIITVWVIIAGRSVDRFWQRYEQAYSRQPVPRRIDLAPFDEHPIRALIWNRARAVHTPLLTQSRLLHPHPFP